MIVTLFTRTLQQALEEGTCTILHALAGATIKFVRTLSAIASKLLWAIAKAQGLSLDNSEHCQKLVELSFAGKLAVTFPVTELATILKAQGGCYQSRVSIYKVLNFMSEWGAFLHTGGRFEPHHELKTPTTPYRSINIVNLLMLALAGDRHLKSLDVWEKKDLRGENVSPQDVSFTGNEYVRRKGLENLPKGKAYNVISFFKSWLGIHPNHSLPQEPKTWGEKVMYQLLYGTPEGEEPVLVVPTLAEIEERRIRIMQEELEASDSFSIMEEKIPEPPQEDLPPEPEATEKIVQPKPSLWQRIKSAFNPMQQPQPLPRCQMGNTLIEVWQRPDEEDRYIVTVPFKHF